MVVNVTQQKSWKEKIDIKGGIKTALIVGTTLTLINQWDAILGPDRFSFWAFFLTLLVPFSVYQYGRISND